MNKINASKDSSNECIKTKPHVEDSSEKIKKGLDEQFEKVLASDLDSLEKRILGQDFS